MGTGVASGSDSFEGSGAGTTSSLPDGGNGGGTGNPNLDPGAGPEGTYRPRGEFGG
jgi:hypothetical protein